MTYSTVRVRNTFPPDRRPIYATPVAEMSHKNKAEAWPVMAQAVRGVLKLHPDERVLIHTVSYDLTTHLFRDLISKGFHNRVLTYRNAQERDKAIALYRKRPGSVLIAPSLERGVDFAGDDCRVVVVCKIPFPNLGDKQVSARLHSKGGQMWYSVQTVRSLVQMTGRGFRSADDTCITYILDAQFVSNVWAKSKALLPAWWAEAVDMSGRFVRELKRMGV